MSIRDRYIKAMGEIVGRDKKYRNLVAYVNATGDNYSTLSKVMNPETYKDLQPTLVMCENICLNSDVNGHWLLTGAMPKAGSKGMPTSTKEEKRLEALELRLDRIEKALSKKLIGAAARKK
ncbi:MAG: hypothetical protein JST76_06260 [Bacteroidetes bacterium]|nr:hypothetical protein [Bacteroidota bacterium]MBS1618101.1 hypothetical protein [Bacteroidota bacterium]